jgi:uncharacterized protein (AIM24 family)
MKEQLLGTTLPVLSISLDPGESVVAEAGEFSWMTDSIQMSTGMSGGGRSAGAGAARGRAQRGGGRGARGRDKQSAGAGQAERGGGTSRARGWGERSGGAGGHGVMGALKRATGGSSLFLSTYTAKDAAGVIAFASKLPGSILSVEIGSQRGGGREARGREEHSEYLVHRHGFLAGTPGIEISAGFQQSFSAGIFAGEGFVLQRIGGQGRAWIELAGEVVTYNLAPGESLRAHPGHVGMFTASVSFQVMRVPGITNRYFGGDEHHFAVLSGPGLVWLQSMPMPVLAASLAPYLPQAQAQEQAHGAAEGGVVGGIIGDLLH